MLCRCFLTFRLFSLDRGQGNDPEIIMCCICTWVLICPSGLKYYMYITMTKYKYSYTILSLHSDKKSRIIRTPLQYDLHQHITLIIIIPFEGLLLLLLGTLSFLSCACHCSYLFSPHEKTWTVTTGIPSTIQHPVGFWIAVQILTL